VVLLVDIRRGFEEDDGQLAEFVATCRERQGEVALIVAATKLDKIALSKRKPALAALSRAVKGTVGQPVGFSAVTGEGRDALWSRLRAALG
jgi:GTP-binding protein EngB required for normal cell division